MAAKLIHMKNFFLLLLPFLIIAAFSCKKEDLDPDYPFTIEVKTFNDSIPVTNVSVEVFTPVQKNVVEMLGYTNEEGKVSFSYDKEAVLLVRASRGSNPYTYLGCTDIRLEPNKTVVKTVYLEKYDPNVPGCTYSP